MFGLRRSIALHFIETACYRGCGRCMELLLWEIADKFTLSEWKINSTR